MAKAMRVCAQPGCPVLVQQGRCQAHEREQDRARGSRQQRGYDAQHDRLRRWWKPKVEAGLVDCLAEVCLLPHRRIWLGMEWQLGHTPDRTAYRGPEHKLCNEAEGGRMSHGG